SERSYGKSFIINSPLGYVIPVEEPGSDKGIPTNLGYGTHFGETAPNTDIFIFKNGEVTTITAVYLYNGEYWGVMSPSHVYQPPGWVLMDDLLMRYESEDFERENEDEIYEFTGTFNTLPLKKLVVWQWPGSDREKIVIDVFYIENYENVYFAYKDSEGREWGQIASGWICLSDPENKTDIPSFNPALKPVKWSHDGNRDWTNEATVWPSADPTAEKIHSIDIMLLIFISVFILAMSVLMIGLVHRAKTKKE
ncbi:MAG TPA: hypothetical protein PLV03_10210, partial [Clostridiales bacterium]|nr:hypothetical protein [Clostridiales bacterium]